MNIKVSKELTCEDVLKAGQQGDELFERFVKQEFDKMIKDYDRVHDVLWGALEKCICDCDKNYGRACKYPEKYKDGGCK